MKTELPSMIEVLDRLGNDIKTLENIIEQCAVALRACQRSQNEGLSYPKPLVDHCLKKCDEALRDL